MRRSGSFLAGRDYNNPEIAAVKFGLAVDIQRAIALLDATTQAEVAARLCAAGVLLSEPDVSAILNSNVKAFALDRLMQVVAALGTTVTVSSRASKDEVGRVQVRRLQPKRQAGQSVPQADATP